MKRRTAKHKTLTGRRHCTSKKRLLWISHKHLKLSTCFSEFRPQEKRFFLKKNMPCRVKMHLNSLFTINPYRHENRWFPAHADITAEPHRVIKQHVGITVVFQLHRLFSDFFFLKVFSYRQRKTDSLWIV